MASTPDIDTNFIAVDSDARMQDVADLTSSLSARRVVIRDLLAEMSQEDDEDLYFVIDSDQLFMANWEPDASVGETLVDATTTPASVMHASTKRRGGGRATPAPPSVVLEEGVVTGLVDQPGPPDGDPPGGGESPFALAVVVDHAQSVAVGDSLSLLIRLSLDMTLDDSIPIAAEVGDEIDVVVSPRNGFVVEGKAEGRLQVAESGVDPLPIQIRLRATIVGKGEVTVFAFRQGTPLGSVTITPQVLEAGASAGGTATARGDLSDVRPSADLEMVILEQHDAAGHPELRYLLSAKDLGLGLNLKQFGPVSLAAGPGSFFTDLYREIEDLPLDTADERTIATERLHALGSTLFTELLPPDLRVLLWELQDRIKSVLVQSQEPWVPWEICRLQGSHEGRIVEGKFFCEAFELTRWIPGVPRQAEFAFAHIGLIVPDDSGLPSAKGEVTMVHGLASADREVIDIEPDYVHVRQAFADASHDTIHFTGHGKFPDHSNPTKAEISLAGKQKLRPTDISGVTSNLGLAKPLVFFNACQVGRQAPSLTGVGGWASAMLRAGASAFVGTHWEVTDDLALIFATRFYESLRSGATISAATRDARSAIQDTGDPTWLAYTVFADPDATVTR